MCPGNGTTQCALGIRLSNVCWLANVPWEWDYPMCPGNGTSQCAPGMGLTNVAWEWDNPMSPGNGTIQCMLEKTSQCALGMRKTMCPGNGTSHVPRELD